MNDKLKKFIDENRDAFDSANPRPELVEKLKKQWQQNPEAVTSHKMKIVWRAVAAAGIIILSLVLFYSLRKNPSSTDEAIVKTGESKEISPTTDPIYAKQIGYYRELIGLQQ